MRYILLKDAKPGMRLGADIYDAYGRVLLGNRAELEQEYIDKLLSLGFDGLYITDELSDDIEIEAVITPALRAKGIECVRQQNIDGCLEVAKDIVNQIMEKGNISLDMADLRESDDYTFSHSVNVAVYSCVMGLGLNMTETELEALGTAGLLHDLGKMSIPLEILNKKGRLTQEEYQIMKSHAQLSYDTIKGRWDISTHVKVAVLFHHENVDGSGYPKGIKGEEQTLYTKIIHVADVYDALVSKRPYKKAYNAYDASEYMMGGCGIMFDRDVVVALLAYVPLYPKGTEMILSTGEHCIIVENSGVHNLRPIVRMLDGRTLDLTKKENLTLTLKSVVEDDAFSPEYEAERLKMIGGFYRHKVLVVDDMMTNLSMMRGILEYIYDVTLVKSGKQALAYLSKNERPDIVIMDIDMPEMDGVETAKHIMEMTNNELPILFVTTVNDRDTVIKCKEMGAAGYIVRPYQPAYIKSEIKRILTGRGDAE